jgi:hypothetical protein
MASKRINIAGKRFNSLTTLQEYRITNNRHTEWLCRCDCGNLTWVLLSHLRNGTTKSCGCRRGEHFKGNVYNLTGKFGIGYTSNDKPFFFDIEDYDTIKKYTWSYSSSGYVHATVGKRKIKMHQLVLPGTNELVIDHRNQCKHDNRKINLRLCTKSHNGINRNNQKGYCYRSDCDKYEVHIGVNGKIKYIGLYVTKEEARFAYEDAIKKYYGSEWIPYNDNISDIPRVVNE